MNLNNFRTSGLSSLQEYLLWSSWANSSFCNIWDSHRKKVCVNLSLKVIEAWPFIHFFRTRWMHLLTLNYSTCSISTTLSPEVPPKLPWISISYRDYWYICYNAVLGGVQWPSLLVYYKALSLGEVWSYNAPCWSTCLIGPQEIHWFLLQIPPFCPRDARVFLQFFQV